MLLINTLIAHQGTDKRPYLKAHIVCNGLPSQAAGWSGYPWSCPGHFSGVRFCSSKPQLFDYVNDPYHLTLSSNAGAPAPAVANITVPFRNFNVMCDAIVFMRL